MLSAPYDEIRAVPRAALSVLHVLFRTGSRTGTYAGLALALGLSDKTVRHNVLLGVRAGVFQLGRTGVGRGAKTLVSVTPLALRINSFLFGEDDTEAPHQETST